MMAALFGQRIGWDAPLRRTAQQPGAAAVPRRHRVLRLTAVASASPSVSAGEQAAAAAERSTGSSSGSGSGAAASTSARSASNGSAANGGAPQVGAAHAPHSPWTTHYRTTSRRPINDFGFRRGELWGGGLAPLGGDGGAGTGSLRQAAKGGGLGVCRCRWELIQIGGWSGWSGGRVTYSGEPLHSAALALAPQALRSGISWGTSWARARRARCGSR